MSDPTQQGSVALGVLIRSSLHMLQIPIVIAVQVLGRIEDRPWAIALLGWSVTQLLYMVPATLFARARGAPYTARGIMIVAGISVLLNGACDALVLSTFRIRRSQKLADRIP